jgi:hypothetical protein
MKKYQETYLSTDPIIAHYSNSLLSDNETSIWVRYKLSTLVLLNDIIEKEIQKELRFTWMLIRLKRNLGSKRTASEFRRWYQLWEGNLLGGKSTAEKSFVLRSLSKKQSSSIILMYVYLRKGYINIAQGFIDVIQKSNSMELKDHFWSLKSNSMEMDEGKLSMKIRFPER